MDKTDRAHRCIRWRGERNWGTMGVLKPQEWGGRVSEGIVRMARAEDAAGIAHVHVESWRSTYPGLLPDSYLARLCVDRHTRRWQAMLADHSAERRTLVAVSPSDGIIGFASCGPQRTALGGFGGEFYAIYLADHAQGQGWGRRLMGNMAVEMLAGNRRSAVVWVLRENPSRWFYERLGGVRLAEQPIYFAGVRLTEVAYGWSDLLPLARQAADPQMR